MHALPRGLGLAGARLPAAGARRGRGGDVDLLANVANGIGGNTICALGDAVAWPMLGFLTKFRADFEARMSQGAAREGARGPDRDRRRARRSGGMNIAGAEPRRWATRSCSTGWPRCVAFFAIFTITRKNPVTAVMSLVATFFGLAAIYASLSAHFLAVLQVLVYAGAIMVLFIFVVMILNREEVAPLALRPMRAAGRRGRRLPDGEVRGRRHRGVGDAGACRASLPETYGTVAAVGDMLFREFLYPFEAISLLLLVAIVGGVVVSRSHQKEVAAQRAADYRKQVHDLASHDYPGIQPPRR